MRIPFRHFDRFGDLVEVDVHGPIERYAAVQMYRRAAVLLKIVRPPSGVGGELADAVEAQKRLLLEAVATDRVVHPNVVRVIDAGISRDLVSFVALEWIHGETLTDHLARSGRIEIEIALDLAVELARAVCAAHARGVIHGDITPHNVLLLDEGAKLTGFGRGRAPDTDFLRTAGQAQGTPGYMCPRYAATGALDERSDLYSLGTTIYEALSGVSPVAARGRCELSEPSLELRIGAPRGPLPLCELVPGVGIELSSEIQRAMSLEPENRHHSVEEFLSVLEHHRRRIARCGVTRGHTAADHDSPTVPIGIVAARRNARLDEARGCCECRELDASPPPHIARPATLGAAADSRRPHSSSTPAELCPSPSPSPSPVAGVSRGRSSVPKWGARCDEHEDAPRSVAECTAVAALAVTTVQEFALDGRCAHDAAADAWLSGTGSPMRTDGNPHLRASAPSPKSDRTRVHSAGSPAGVPAQHARLGHSGRSAMLTKRPRNDETVYGIPARPRASPELVTKGSGVASPPGMSRFAKAAPLPWPMGTASCLIALASFMRRAVLMVLTRRRTPKRSR